MDGFKSINDIFCHPVGDHSAIQWATRLATCIRLANTVFVTSVLNLACYCPEFQGGDEAAAVSETIRPQLETPNVLDGEFVMVHAGIGDAATPSAGRNYRALIKQANMAMYRAKHNSIT